MKQRIARLAFTAATFTALGFGPCTTVPLDTSPDGGSNAGSGVALEVGSASCYYLGDHDKECVTAACTAPNAAVATPACTMTTGGSNGESFSFYRVGADLLGIESSDDMTIAAVVTDADTAFSACTGDTATQDIPAENNLYEPGDNHLVVGDEYNDLIVRELCNTLDGSAYPPPQPAGAPLLSTAQCYFKPAMSQGAAACVTGPCFVTNPLSATDACSYDVGDPNAVLAMYYFLVAGTMYGTDAAGEIRYYTPNAGSDFPQCTGGVNGSDGTTGSGQPRFTPPSPGADAFSAEPLFAVGSAANTGSDLATFCTSVNGQPL
jgi:hypothetical protein